MEKVKAVFNWSGGKDSALALYRVLRGGRYEVTALLTTVGEETGRTALHGIPEGLLRCQAERIGIPLHVVRLSSEGDKAGNAMEMARTVECFRARGVTHFVFGDIFLPGVRAYRERRLRPCGIEVKEPLWGLSPREVMGDFLASGFRTVVVAAMDGELGREAVGRTVDAEFVASIPPQVDLCGERGEYHTFCYDGPIFRSPVPFSLGEPFRRSFDVWPGKGTGRTDTYWFADLREASSPEERPGYGSGCSYHEE